MLILGEAWLERFDLEIVISDLKNFHIFIFMQFIRKASNSVENGRYIELAILSFLCWLQNRNQRPRKLQKTFFLQLFIA